MSMVSMNDALGMILTGYGLSVFLSNPIKVWYLEQGTNQTKKETCFSTKYVSTIFALPMKREEIIA